MMNLLNKPKKTILVKVSSNDQLPSKSDLATKNEDEHELQVGRTTLSPHKHAD